MWWIIFVIVASCFVVPESCLLTCVRRTVYVRKHSYICFCSESLSQTLWIASQIVTTTSLLQCKADLRAACRQSAVPRSGPRCICLCAAVHPLLQTVRLACLHHGFFSVAHAYLWFSPADLLTQNYIWTDWGIQQRHLPEEVFDLFWQPQIVLLFRDNHRHVILIQRFCPVSLVWVRCEERKKKKWSLKKNSPWTRQATVWLVRK